MNEIPAQLDNFILYFRGVLSFVPASYPRRTLGPTVWQPSIALKVGEFVAIYYKAQFNRPRPCIQSPRLMPPIDVSGDAS